MRAITQFNPGDEVVIRDWDDMMEEYGENPYGNVKCRFTFTDEMEQFCGQQHTIKEIIDGEVKFVHPDPEMKYYSFSTDMMRHVDDPEYTDEEEVAEADPDQFFGLLN